MTNLFVFALLACDSSTPAPEAPAPEPAAKAEPAAEKPVEAPAEAARKVFFKSPADGATVKSPVKLEFGVEGMEVKPAGELIEGTGHHHVIIDSAGVAEGTVVPADETHIHFGLGQTEAEIELPAGEHKLTMQFADGAHTSYGEVMAATITITVEE
ncbi:MAG: DUF4399 domain-containing protein [Myxococcota bacterium]